MQKDGVEKLCKIVRDLFTALGVVEFCSGDGEIEVKGDTLDVLGGLWASYETKEVKTPFGKLKGKVNSYVVGVVEIHRNYPHEPDDSEPVEVAEFSNVYDAAAKLAELYWNDRTRQALEVIQYDEEPEAEEWS